MFTVRFDMRTPEFGASPADLYSAALDMSSYVETRGGLCALVCEHHSTSDGYLPAPVVMASAIAARTTTIPIMSSALVLPLYDPIRLAEDLVVLDLVSRGRASHILAVGYRAEEFEHLGVDFHRRGRIADAHLDVLMKAKTGERFLHEGRWIQVTPAPFTPGGPKVHIGGGGPAAARRAGRYGLDLYARGGGKALIELYGDECRANGFAPGFAMVPRPDMPTAVFVADDVDEAWAELGPHILHDVTEYASINPDAAVTASMSTATTIEALRAEAASHRILTPDETVELIRSGHVLQLHPLIGGLDPVVAWRYLRNVTEAVVPRL